MSTPVFEEKKAAATEVNLSVRMQKMIDLQNDHIKMSQTEQNTADTAAMTQSASRGEPPESTVPISEGTRSSLGAKTMSRSVRLSSLAQEQSAEATCSDDVEQPPATQNTNDNFHQEPGVGRGTLYFNTEKLGSAASAVTQSVRSDNSSFPLSAEGRRLLMPVPVENHGLGYGSVDVPPPASNKDPSQYQDQSNPRPSEYGYSQYPQGEYTQKKGGSRSQQQHSTYDSIREASGMICSHLCKLLCTIVCCCSTDIEQLQRSFCYGAIDGMLTGSGIVAAFCGMGVLAPTSTITIRTFVVAFSAAACFADSLCMALGHVWTTHVLVSAQARERTATRASVDQNRADAKGRLVDMLLERGMLKIDAMSLVDTLEGYPDMFVSALVGDALIAGGVGSATDSSPDLRLRSVSGGRMSPSASRAWSGHHWNTGEDYNKPMAEQESGGSGTFKHWKFPSYGQHIDEPEQEIDPEAGVVEAALAGSRREGMFMMIGFSLFAVVPSLICLVCPMPQSHLKSSETELNSDQSGGSTSATSIVITTAAVIMWCLGVWKSRFLDSNWMLFGIETVVVMLVCIAAAYGVGYFLSTCFPGLDALINGYTTMIGKSANF